jgi:hypothetical protein
LNTTDLGSYLFFKKEDLPYFLAACATKPGLVRLCRMIRALVALTLAFSPAFAADPPAAQSAPAPTAKVAASGIIGRKVVGPDNNEIGHVIDVLVDAGSNPRAAVIDFGGFLGVGARKIAVNWSDLTFPPTGSDADIRLDLTADQIRAAPAYTDQTKPASVVQPPPLSPVPPLPAGH